MRSSGGLLSIMWPTKPDLYCGSLEKEQTLFVPVPANLPDRYTALRTHPPNLWSCLQAPLLSLRASPQLTPARSSSTPLPHTKRPYPQFAAANAQVTEAPTLSSVAVPTFAFYAGTTLVPFNCFATYSIKRLDTFDICQTSPTACQHQPPTTLQPWRVSLSGCMIGCYASFGMSNVSVRCLIPFLRAGQQTVALRKRFDGTGRLGRVADYVRRDVGRRRWT
jgi:hypothetical protein